MERIELIDVFKELGVNPSDYCITLKGIELVKTTTFDKNNDHPDRTSLGHGHYKINTSPGIYSLDKGNSSHSGRP